MKQTFLSVLALVVFSQSSMAATNKRLKCDSDVTTTGVEVEVPRRMGDLPFMDFDYPVSVTLFSFRDANLLLVAMDKTDASRTRVVVSAQLNRKTGKYEGQMVSDLGGNELQVENGPVTCVLD